MPNNGKKSFVLYHDVRGPLELLTDEERGKLFLAILNCSEYGEAPDFTGALRMAFAFIQTALDRDAAAWESKREKRREAGSLGGKQRVANQANATFAKQTKQTQANQAVPAPVPVPVNVNVNVKEKEAIKPPRATRFSPPTVEQVAEYCRERGNGIDAQHFVDFYASKNWMIGKNKMRDWQASIRTWEKRGRENNQQAAIPEEKDYFEGWGDAL